MMTTFSLLPRWEFTTALYKVNADDDPNTDDGYSMSLYFKYMLFENAAKTGGVAFKGGTGLDPGYLSSVGVEDAFRTYWVNAPVTFPFFGNKVSLDLMPGASYTEDYGEEEEGAWAFTYSTRVAVYPASPKWATGGGGVRWGRGGDHHPGVQGRPASGTESVCDLRPDLRPGIRRHERCEARGRDDAVHAVVLLHQWMQGPQVMRRSRFILALVWALAVALAWPLPAAAQTADTLAKGKKTGFGTYTEGTGFKIADTEHGDLNVKLFTYLRYLNQLGHGRQLHRWLRQHEDRCSGARTSSSRRSTSSSWDGC